MKKKMSKLNYLKIIQKKNWLVKMQLFKCKIVNIQSPIEQKIDDSLAKNMGAKDLADLKSIIEKQISKEYESITTQLIKKKILDQLISNIN